MQDNLSGRIINEKPGDLKEFLRFFLDSFLKSVYNKGACMKARSLFVWENAGKCMQKAEKRQPTVNITGGETNANI